MRLEILKGLSLRPVVRVLVEVADPVIIVLQVDDSHAHPFGNSPNIAPRKELESGRHGPKYYTSAIMSWRLPPFCTLVYPICSRIRCP